MAKNTEQLLSSTASIVKPETLEVIDVIPNNQNGASEAPLSEGTTAGFQVKPSQTSTIEGISSTPISEHREIESLCVNDSVDHAGLVKSLDKIPVGRRGDQEWIRIHKDPSYTRNVALIDYKVADGKKVKGKDFFLVVPKLRNSLAGEFYIYTLFLGITRQNVLFMWPIRLPGEDGTDNDWWVSAREHAQFAKDKWIRVISNTALGAYEKYPRGKDWDHIQPEWPEPLLPFDKLLRIAFKDKIIEDMNHPLVKELRG
jgi:hypothetical protein